MDRQAADRGGGLEHRALDLAGLVPARLSRGGGVHGENQASLTAAGARIWAGAHLRQEVGHLAVRGGCGRGAGRRYRGGTFVGHGHASLRFLLCCVSRGRFQGIAGVKIDIRAIRPNDADAVVAMAAALSAHEGKAPPPFDVAAFRRHGFGARALFDGMIAETGGEAVGYALFREMFNIDSGRPGLHMMDLFVQPEHRRGGAGRALLAALRPVAWPSTVGGSPGNASSETPAPWPSIRRLGAPLRLRRF